MLELTNITIFTKGKCGNPGVQGTQYQREMPEKIKNCTVYKKKSHTGPTSVLLLLLLIKIQNQYRQ